MRTQIRDPRTGQPAYLSRPSKVPLALLLATMVLLTVLAIWSGGAP